MRNQVRVADLVLIRADAWSISAREELRAEGEPSARRAQLISRGNMKNLTSSKWGCEPSGWCSALGGTKTKCWLGQGWLDRIMF